MGRLCPGIAIILVVYGHSFRGLSSAGLSLRITRCKRGMQLAAPQEQLAKRRAAAWGWAYEPDKHGRANPCEGSGIGTHKPDQITPYAMTMPYDALATDYDGTIALDGVVDGTTRAALHRLRDAGWRLVLATGRELDDVRDLMPDLHVFERVVAENGAVLHTPGTGQTRLLAPVPPPGFVEDLAARGITPLHQGSVVVETWQSYESIVRAVIRQRGFNLAVVSNKGALMIVPAGVNKGTGAAAALDELGIPPSRCVALGDAENDLDLFALCGLSVAVAGALPEAKQAADMVLKAEGGQGVAELVSRLLGG
jgi:hydroxymethylpyrimidine pyrophosphatase-like HAD family hydrolase